MTPRETATFNAGIAYAAEMARIAAVTIEIRDDASNVRQQAAAAALHGLAEELRHAVKPAFLSGPGNAELSGIYSPRAVATAHRFTGDTCDACGSAEMNRSGTCLTCTACGVTTGCG